MIPNFKASAKILKRFDHLWIQLLLVQKHQTQKHQQQNLQHVKKKHEKNKYQRTPIQTQVRQTHRRSIMIRPTAAIINAEDIITRKIIGNEINRIL